MRRGARCGATIALMPNHLANEASLYLRQHADNPVDWWPWGDDAFADARERGRRELRAGLGHEGAAKRRFGLAEMTCFDAFLREA